MGGTVDHSSLSPHVAGNQYGTSPGNQSDMSNEAQFHHNNDALSDVSATGELQPTHPHHCISFST